MVISDRKRNIFFDFAFSLLKAFVETVGLNSKQTANVSKRVYIQGTVVGGCIMREGVESKKEKKGVKIKREREKGERNGHF